MIGICPNCNKRFVYDEHSNDFIHDCSVADTETLRNEDKLVTGNQYDETETLVASKNPQEVTRQGIENELFGTRAGIDGDKIQRTTSRGNRKSTHYQEVNKEYIDLSRDNVK